jgi:hypothetical protein
VRFARSHTTRFLLGLIAVLALPALVWGIQAVTRDSSGPAGSEAPAAVVDPPRHDELGCSVLTAPESLADRAAACETEPPPVSKPDKERKQPRKRSGRVAASAMGATTTCTAACETGTIESVGEATAPAETKEEAQGVTDLVGSISPLARVIPTDRLDEAEERVGRVVDETLGGVEVPDEAPDVPTEILEDALVPDGVDTLPAIEIELDPAPSAPTPVPDPPAAVDPPAGPVPAPDEEDPAASDESELTTLLVTDEETAEKLGIPHRMTITLSPQVVRALAILSKRNGLELSATAADSAAPSRD